MVSLAGQVDITVHQIQYTNLKVIHMCLDFEAEVHFDSI
jgi:hypothetical protein